MEAMYINIALESCPSDLYLNREKHIFLIISLYRKGFKHQYHDVRPLEDWTISNTLLGGEFCKLNILVIAGLLGTLQDSRPPRQL